MGRQREREKQKNKSEKREKENILSNKKQNTCKQATRGCINKVVQKYEQLDTIYNFVEFAVEGRQLQYSSTLNPGRSETGRAHSVVARGM